MLTRSEIRCEKLTFFDLFRLKYCILCPFWTKTIAFELNCLQCINPTKPNIIWIQTIGEAE